MKKRSRMYTAGKLHALALINYGKSEEQIEQKLREALIYSESDIEQLMLELPELKKQELRIKSNVKIPLIK